MLKCVDTIRANEFVRKYFVNTDPDKELLHQVPIYFDYILDEQVHECKALLDGILIDHKARTIQPFDLKTTGKSVWEFSSSFLHFGYYRQCAFYEEALYSTTSPVRKLLDEGYEMLDFIFIPVETKSDSYNPALIYRTSPSERYCGLNGCSLGERYYPGINDLIRAYKWHTDNDYWELPKSVYDSGGEINFNLKWST